MSEVRRSVAAFLFGNFVIGTGVMVVPGMLRELAAGLEVSVPRAGQLITLAAFVMCVGAPLAAALTSSFDRRRLLVGTMLVYAAGHAICALAPGYGSLAIARAIGVAGAAVFTPQAAATIALMVAPQYRSAAVSSIFLGWSVASVLGMPLGNLVGAHLGWRWGFAMVAALSLLSALWVARATPSGLTVPALSASDWRAVLTDRRLVTVLAVTLASGAGGFTLFAYIAPVLAEVTGAGPGAIAAILAAFGAFGVAGNTLTARRIGRWGPDRAVARGLKSMAIGLAFWIGVMLVPAATWPMLAGAVVFWGLGVFATNSSQQARLASIAPGYASASIALNTSCIYAGQAIGAATGGALIAAAGIQALPWVALAAMLGTLALSARVSSKAPAH